MHCRSTARWRKDTIVVSQVDPIVDTMGLTVCVWEWNVTYIFVTGT
jgi:hypothetical protein